MERLRSKLVLHCALILLLGAAQVALGVVRPPNNDCIDAEPVGNVTDLSFDTTDATFDGPGHYLTTKNLWYNYTATCSGNATISLLGSAYDTKLAVYDGNDCGPALEDLLAHNDDFHGLQSQVTLPVVHGNQYLIEVGGWTDSDFGEGLISISCDFNEPAPPANDDCDHAEPIGDVADLMFDTRHATPDGPGHCMHSPNIWYCYTATCTGHVTVSLLGSIYDTTLAVYDGNDCDLAPEDMINCNDDFGDTWQSQITFAATAGHKYLIEIGGYSHHAGEGVLNISCEGPAPQKPDLGDAPDSTNNSGAAMTAYPLGGPAGVHANYPTVFNDGSGTGPYGPLHLNPLAVAHLGETVTHEAEADIGPDQDGVNNIDPPADSPDQEHGDDGVVFPVNLPNCRWATFDYIVNVIDPNVDLWVNVWCDWNRDGDWDDILDCLRGPAPEWAVQNQLLFNLPAGLNQITTPAFLSSHPAHGPEEIWMRITLSERPWKGGSNHDHDAIGNGGSGPQGKYEIGETEDYYFAPDVSFTICEDLNGDGSVDIIDLVEFVNEWFENCLL